MVSYYIFQRYNYYLYCILFVVFQVAGILPIYRNIVPKLSHHRCHSNEDCFSSSASLRVLVILQVLLCGFMLFGVVYNASSSNLSLSTLRIIHWLSSFTTLCLSLSNIHHLVECTSGICKIFHSLPKKLKYIPIPLFTLVVLTPFLPIINLFRYIELQWKVLLKFYLFNYAFVSISSVESLFCILCFIVKRAYIGITLNLEYCMEKRPRIKNMSLLKHLLNKHILIGKCVKSMASYFSLHFLNSFLTFTLRNIIHAAIFSWLRNYDKHSDIEAVIQHSLYLIVRLIFICYMCHKVKEEACKARFIVGNFQVRWLEDLTKKESELIDTYIELLDATSVDFYAGGLFPMTIVQLLSVCSIITTYGIAAFQAK